MSEPVRTGGGADTVGFVGVGRMGTPMVRRLVAAGWNVRAHDADPEALLRTAAHPAASPARAAEGASAVVLMLPSSDVVEAVLRDNGLFDALEPGTVLVDMGSSRPMSTRELAKEAAGRGVAFVDAPVSGGVRGAEGGSLTIMAGGAPEDLARVRPLLDVLGSGVVHAGPVGAGHALKAFNNLMSAAHLLATSEAVLAGREFGLDPAVMLDAVNASTGRSGSSEVKWPRFILPGTYDSGFALRLMLKDMRIAVELAAAQGRPARLGQAAMDLWARAERELPDGADHTEIARWLDESGSP